RRLDLAKRVQELYVEAQTAELNVELARNRAEIAAQLEKEVKRRVDDARDPLFAGTRARTELEQAKVDLELAEHAAEAAKSRLALLIGSGSAESLDVSTEGFLDLAPANVAPDAFAAPDLAVYEARSRRADA
ncbi:TolC family protein, partial [Blastomonas sp. CCH2-A2]|uniref:TolC family protein n=1 Tax=Blastomonas sp. CCH2-A2 TaxID=1768788 RepID=UPI0018D23F32